MALGNVGGREDDAVLAEPSGRPEPALRATAARALAGSHARADADASSERLRCWPTSCAAPSRRSPLSARPRRPVTASEASAALVALAIAAARDVERLLADPELVSVRSSVSTSSSWRGVRLAHRGRSRAGGEASVERDPDTARQALGNLVANGLRHGTLVVVDVRRATGA